MSAMAVATRRKSENESVVKSGAHGGGMAAAKNDGKKGK
jgi:hypothetical protein